LKKVLYRINISFYKGGISKGIIPPTRRLIMTQNLTDLAQAAIDALKAFNTERDRQQREWAQSRFGKNFRGNGPDIHEHQHIELRQEIVHFDEQPLETLEELVWLNNMVEA
jgi:hypothetical protein